MGWGDGVPHGYDAGLDDAIIFRTATGMKSPSGRGSYRVQTLGRFDVAGVHYHRWNLVLDVSPDRAPLPGNLGTFTSVQVAVFWPLLALLAMFLICLWLLVKERRRWLASRSQLCRNCGYDLRATPDRCPECGLEPAPLHTSS